MSPMSKKHHRRSRSRPDPVYSVPVADIETFFTEQDRADKRRVMDLEAEGDLVGALRALRRTARVVGNAHERHLAEMVRFGDEAPGWLWGRSVLGAAYRWALASEDPRVAEAVLAVYVATYREQKPFDRHAGTALAASDGLVQDIVVFDLGVLDDYLDVRAGAVVLERAACARSWGSGAPTVGRLGGLAGDRVMFADEVSGGEVPVIHTGEAMGTCRDEWVLGRVVPAGSDGTVFASRPIVVGELAGRRLARTLRRNGGWQERLEDLFVAITAGALPPRPGWLAASTSLASGGSLHDDVAWRDLDDSTPAPRTQELMAEGLSRATADHLCVLELALEIASREIAGSVEMVAQHAGIALTWPEVRREAARRYADPAHCAAWARLAACLPAHARGPFESLAGAC
ncbi:MAG: hypothetical protein ACRDWY_14605 [Actinomycetes bacterium]